MSYHCGGTTPHSPHTTDRGAFGRQHCGGTPLPEVDPQPEGQAPVAGYTTQPPEAVDLVNLIKGYENAIGDLVAMVEDDDVPTDPRLVALARTNLQQGFMWLVRAVFQPESRL